MQEELWIEIEQFSKYRVSNYGRVENHVRDQLLKPIVKLGGRCAVGLVHDRLKTQRYFFISDLVWDYFGDADRTGFIVLNADGDFFNNAIWNLELAKRTQRSRVRVREVETGMVFDSIRDAEKYFDLGVGRVGYAIRRPGQLVAGHRFEIA